VNWVAFSGWAGVTLVGILQAQLAFVPERVTYEPRALPPRPKLAPSVSLALGGMGIGLTGQF
jgi:hypothetical protein